jgi:hypothetical protein
MRTKLTKVLPLALSLLAACHDRQPVSRMLLPSDNLGSRFWLGAPLIVVGTVASVRAEDLGASAAGVSPVTFSIDVEASLQGDLQLGQVQAQCYFLTSVTKGVAKPSLGERRVFFLRREQELIRCFADGTQPDLTVHSGAPTEVPPGSVGTKILATILHPGRGFNPAVFTSHLAYSFISASRYGSRVQAFHLLSKLVEHPASEVREASCLVLSEHYPGHDQCLDEHIGNGRYAQRAREARLRRKTDDQDTLRRLKSGGALHFGSTGEVDDAVEALLLLASHRNPEISASACHALLFLVARQSWSEACIGEKREKNLHPVE